VDHLPLREGRALLAQLQARSEPPVSGPVQRPQTDLLNDIPANHPLFSGAQPGCSRVCPLNALEGELVAGFTRSGRASGWLDFPDLERRISRFEIRAGRIAERNVHVRGL